MALSPELFRTDSLYVACFLMAQGRRFLHIEPMPDHPSGKQYFYFCFREDPDLVRLNQDFNNNADVPVGLFVNALNTLKGVIRAEIGTSTAG